MQKGTRAAPTPFCTLPTLVVQPFIENAIIHGLLPRIGAEGTLSIVFSALENDAGVCVTIRDNGLGRAAAERTKTCRAHL